MDSMDNVRERLEALEQQRKAMEAHTHTVERRLRRWRGMAGGLLVLGLLSWALPSGKAADAPGRGMAERMATLEKKLTAMTFDDASNEVVISGANLRIVNGLGTTDTANGLGNLLVGYNESRQEFPFCSGSTDPFCTDRRTGSHNVVVGRQHNFSSFGGLVVGELNEISEAFAAVSGGFSNIASGLHTSVSGGFSNTASGLDASVSGGNVNVASGGRSSVSGGGFNTASGGGASVSGGANSTANGTVASVSGGDFNTASGEGSSVSGGFANRTIGLWSSVSGGNRNQASGDLSSVSGGEFNVASGEGSSVSGGNNRTAPGQFNWAAGALFSDM